MKKPIPNFEKYYIYDTGDVYNTDTNKMLEGTIRLSGYKVYRLSKDGKKYQFYAHRLVAENFIPNPDNCKIVNHKDGDKLNNDVSNLEWCTQSENMKHAYDNSLIQQRKQKQEYHNIEGECWKLIEPYENYYISNYGRVLNKKTNRILRPSIACGYYKVRLSKHGKIQDYLVHYLVQEYFNHRLPNDDECIDHIDGNKLNNHSDNLRVISWSNNSLYAFYQQGLTKTTKSVQQFSKDGKLLNIFPSCRAAARALNLDSSSISKATRGKVRTVGGFVFKSLNLENFNDYPLAIEEYK